MVNKIFFFLFILLPLFSNGQDTAPESIKDALVKDSIEFEDGPYIIIEDGILLEKSIKNNEVFKRELPKGEFPIEFKPEKGIYKDVNKIAALSDIHGQYDLAVKILKNNKIIDDNLDWNFGTGHFVIVGDIFDRGAEVNELLWLIYKLEKQAEKAGGKVHYLLGNHEYMVMLGDLRYVNRKYRYSAQLLQTRYEELYGTNTVLGRWLRSKPTVVKINDNLFVHGGISKEFLENGFKIDKINKEMRRAIDNFEERPITADSTDIYFDSTGPIWYRGYFDNSLTEEDIDQILSETKSKNIIIGHTTQDQIVEMNSGKIYAVDSGIKNGEYGELLIIEDGKFKRYGPEGELKTFEEPQPKN